VDTAAGERTQVAVVGAGGVGGLLAAEAVAAGHAVVLCVRTPLDRLVVEQPDGGTHEIMVRIATDPDGERPVPWLFLTTKAQDTDGAASWLSCLADAATIVVVLQNGIDHVVRVAPLVSGAAVLPALVYAAVERIAPGHIIHHVGHRIVVPAGELGTRFSKLLAGSSAEIVQERDFLSAVWRKLLSNVAANPITALTLQRMRIMRDPDIRALAKGLLTEAVTVARAAGARLTMDDVDATLDLYSGYREDGGTSMLYDRLAGHKLEHEYITGVIVRTAETHRIDVPLNRALLTLLRALDRGLQSGSTAPPSTK
jgi:2-dehydropantoate 2-reductase